jgi:hypothetical protein
MIRSISRLDTKSTLRMHRLAGVVGLAALAFFVSSLGGAAQAQQDKRVRVNNTTSHTIVAVYSRATGTRSWTPNIISGRRIGPKSALTINFSTGAGGCKHDLRVVFDNRAEQSNQGIDVCRVGTLTYQ